MKDTKKKSDTSRAFLEDGALKTHVGGQALIEGIMMRGKYNWAVAVRDPYGNIYLEEHEHVSVKKRSGARTWPFVRGCYAFVDSLVLGFKALSIAAEHAFIEDGEGNVYCYSPDGDTPEIEQAKSANGDQDLPVHKNCENDTHQTTETQPKEEKQSGLGGTAMAFSLVLGLALGVALFIVVPAFLTNLIVGDYGERTLLWNVVDGILRIAIFVFYIWLIGRVPDIKRMFGYHGAEHKAIHCFEHGFDLTPENARTFPCLHVRCGTAFLIMVMILAIFIYTVVPVTALIDALGVTNDAARLALIIAVRILFLPVIAGIAYEITVKWAGTHPNNPVVKVILWPGLQMQRLTTREPDDGQIECAIASMKLVLDYEKKA